jgi:predicted  nucleic acid-binding Zn-ribbon protein
MTDTVILEFLRTSFAQVNGRLDRIDLQLDELTQRISRLERDTAALGHEIANLPNLHSDISRLERDTAALRHEIANLHSDFASLSSRLERKAPP